MRKARKISPAWIFRIALFGAAVSLAAYVPYKYATQLHAVDGLYGFMFPLSALLAAAGLIFAVKPGKACDCGTTLRSGLAVLSGLWMTTGLMCVGALAQSIQQHPLGGSTATFQMLAQHVFLSLALIAFAWAPLPMARALGVLVKSPPRAVAGIAAI